MKTLTKIIAVTSIVLLTLSVLIAFTGCKKEDDIKTYDATLTFYSQHSPFVIKYTDSGTWHTDTISGNTYTKSIKASEFDFNKSQQIKSVQAYPSDSLYIRADIDGKVAERGFKGLYMQIEIDISLSQAK